MTVQDDVVEAMAETAWQAFRDSDKPAPFNQMRDALRAALSGAEREGWVLVPAKKLLEIRDALNGADEAEAYHILYGLACPDFASYTPWEAWEKVAATRQHTDGGQGNG